jgi:hypothetical protein
MSLTRVWRSRARNRDGVAGSAVALAVSLFVFASPAYGDTQIAAATTKDAAATSAEPGAATEDVAIRPFRAESASGAG